MKSYSSTFYISSLSRLRISVIHLLPGIGIRVLFLILLIFIWKSVSTDAQQGTPELSALLTYTLISALLSDFLVLQSPLTNWFYDGAVISYYLRPMRLEGQVIAQTLGTAAPGSLTLILPIGVLAVWQNISLLPQSVWAIPSLMLSISLAFAFEFIFACFFIRMIHATWMAFTIRNSLLWVLSGAVIPFDAMPERVGQVLSLLPFGSMSGAFLSIYSGMSAPLRIIGLQLFWNIVIWPIAIIMFRRAQ